MKKRVVLAAILAFFIGGSFSLIQAGENKAGYKIYKKRCKSCHTLTEKKKVGPGLKNVIGRESKVAGKLDEEGFTKWIKDPAAIYPKSRMAKTFKTKLSDEEIQNLIEYLKAQ